MQATEALPYPEENKTVEELETINPVLRVTHGRQIVLMIPPDGTLWVNPNIKTTLAGELFIKQLNNTIVHTHSSELYQALMKTQNENTHLEREIQELRRINQHLTQRMTEILEAQDTKESNMVPAAIAA